MRLDSCRPRGPLLAKPLTMYTSIAMVAVCPSTYSECDRDHDVGHYYNRIWVITCGCLMWGVMTVAFSQCNSVMQGYIFWGKPRPVRYLCPAGAGNWRFAWLPTAYSESRHVKPAHIGSLCFLLLMAGVRTHHPWCGMEHLVLTAMQHPDAEDCSYSTQQTTQGCLRMQASMASGCPWSSPAGRAWWQTTTQRSAGEPHLERFISQEPWVPCLVRPKASIPQASAGNHHAGRNPEFGPGRGKMTDAEDHRLWTMSSENACGTRRGASVCRGIVCHKHWRVLPPGHGGLAVCVPVCRHSEVILEATDVRSACLV